MDYRESTVHSSTVLRGMPRGRLPDYIHCNARETYGPVGRRGHSLVCSQLERVNDTKDFTETSEQKTVECKLVFKPIVPEDDLLKVPAGGGWIQKRQLQLLVRSNDKYLAVRK